MQVDRVLRGSRTIESGIFAPSAGDVAEIALPTGFAGYTGATGKGFESHIVEALASSARGLAKGFIQRVGNIADGVMQALPQ